MLSNGIGLDVNASPSPAFLHIGKMLGIFATPFGIKPL